jgi:sigma-B regulation protein RsbU (phosphoserine phosphatase)
MRYSTINQRETYKIVEKLTSGKFKTEVSLLKSLVKHIVDNKDFEIIGGRIWELNPAENAYILRFQYGNVKKIPAEYTISIADQPIFSKLKKKRTFHNYETDPILLDKGIELYSVTGVGDLIKLSTGNFYKYAISFNAPQILQSFFELLTIISSVATVALRDLSTKEKERKLQGDIRRASEIQRNLLPDHATEFKDYKIFGVCIPDSIVGGDYFDYIRNPDNQDERLAIIIGDAASKGLSAAIQALFVSGAIRMGMGFSTRISHLMNRLNTIIFDTFPYERFVTMFFCELTASSNRLVLYANAGHCAPIHYSPSNDKTDFLGPTGGLLGIMQNQTIAVENMSMEPGDILVLYTDGIIEARDNNDNFYGEDRLAKLIKENCRESAQVIVYNILEDVQKFGAGSTFNDDKTLVVIKRDTDWVT